MHSIDLFSLQQTYNQQRIMLCFNGPLTRSLIEEIGNALRNYMQRENATASSAMDVFGAYIELTQNIRHYAARKGWDDAKASATVIIARDAEGRYVVSAGNIVDAGDGPELQARVKALAAMDKVQLKARYKEQLRQPRDEGSTTGAGLGLIDLARKAAEPLACSLRTLDDGRAFFSMRVVM
ncbi:MAG TPA: biofilm regulation protein kinase SiaB [Noviherbaspirillum sp.]|uniref:biofilm regulation protein kinase SiaB n=1 Tax=Noviherbaspirillum sp. TaxID=1926288 RepID=UPI002B45A5DE|nr:biofilm regulation protein kinase SiaB [Noviherbaspirillum sp.]HJV87414.1 biofilm regulation protein kinase SiaB [Noviherbaspirillum sp.]